jgi:hypothetical protein
MNKEAELFLQEQGLGQSDFCSRVTGQGLGLCAAGLGLQWLRQCNKEEVWTWHISDERLHKGRDIALGYSRMIDERISS